MLEFTRILPFPCSKTRCSLWLHPIFSTKVQLDSLRTCYVCTFSVTTSSKQVSKSYYGHRNRLEICNLSNRSLLSCGRIIFHRQTPSLMRRMHHSAVGGARFHSTGVTSNPRPHAAMSFLKANRHLPRPPARAHHAVRFMQKPAQLLEPATWPGRPPFTPRSPLPRMTCAPCLNSTAITSGWGTSVSARPFLLDRSRSYTVEPAILRLSESFSRYDTPNLRVRNIHLPLGRLKPSKVPLARYCCCSHPASSTSRWTSLPARLFGHPGRGSDKSCRCWPPLGS